MPRKKKHVQVRTLYNDNTRVGNFGEFGARATLAIWSASMEEISAVLCFCGEAPQEGGKTRNPFRLSDKLLFAK